MRFLDKDKDIKIRKKEKENIELNNEEEKVKEQRAIFSSEFYQDLKNAFRWLGKILVVAGLLYGAYKALHWYVYIGFLLSLPITLVFFYLILRVPSRLVLVLHFSEEPADPEKIAIFSIPEPMFKRFKFKGGNRVEFVSLTGEGILVADDINLKEKVITSPWFAELSNLEFFRKKIAFNKIKEWLIDLYSKEAALYAEREALMAHDFAKLLEAHYQNFEKDFKEPSAVENSFKSILSDRILKEDGGV